MLILGPKEDEGETLLDLREQGNCGVRSASRSWKLHKGGHPLQDLQPEELKEAILLPHCPPPSDLAGALIVPTQWMAAGRVSLLMQSLHVSFMHPATRRKKMESGSGKAGGTSSAHRQ